MEMDMTEKNEAKAMARLAEALRQIASGKYDGLEVTHYTAKECRDLARRALGVE